ncbi:MAG TPA: alpha/beta hydrolase [Thermomicrobiales bacterium]|nr:alpha/beta hydrolase [Thermomicrobiales bacterium]
MSPASREHFAGLVEIGDGRRLYLACKGSGSPAVVLESGYGHSGRAWNTDVLPFSWTPPDGPRATVFEGVSAFTRVCLYDRPGTIFPVPKPFAPSRSDPAPMPRSAGAMVDDLHAGLTAAAIPAPYVFVGHSLGGLLGRAFAGLYPDEVAGLVLVDTFSAELWNRLQAALPARDRAALEALEQGPREELRSVYPEAELLDLNAIVDEAQAITAAHPLRPMPLAVLTRGQPLSDVVPAEAAPADFAWDALEREALAAQHSLAGLVPDARQVILPECGHMIQLDRPDIVIETIRQVVEAVRAPASWTTGEARTAEVLPDRDVLHYDRSERD